MQASLGQGPQTVAAKAALKSGFAHGWELVPNTARLCVMNLYLHGIESDPRPIHAGAEALAGDPGDRFSRIITNPPFGKKSSIAIVNEEGELEKESSSYERQDFWPCLLYTSPSPRDLSTSRMPSSA